MTRMGCLALSDARRGRKHILDLLLGERWRVGPRLMKRLWRAEGRLEPQMRRKRRLIGTSESGIVRGKATMKNEVLGLDFMHDSTVGWRSLKLLVLLEDYTRECLVIEIERTFRGAECVAVLDELTAIYGAPVHRRSQRSRAGIEGGTKLVRARRHRHALHRARSAMAERHRGELQQRAPRRAAVVGDLRDAGRS